MASELTRADREIAIAELERIQETLSLMSQWVDGPSDAREKCSIVLEDAWKSVLAAQRLLSRDAVRVASLVHRRLPPPDSG